MASCIAPITKALTAPFTRLLGWRELTAEELFGLIFGKTNESVRAKMTHEELLQDFEEGMQYYESVRKECTAKIASLREELALLNKTKGKYHKRFLSAIANRIRYAKVKKELEEEEVLYDVAEFAYEICAENFREQLREKWLDTPIAPFGSKSTAADAVVKESPITACDTVSESASDTDFSLSGEEDNHMDEADDVSMIDDSVQSGEYDEDEMYVANDDSSNQDISMIDLVVPSMDIQEAIPHEEDAEIEEADDHVSFSSTVQVPQEPSILAEEQPLSPMEVMMQRLASMRCGIAPKDEDSLLVCQQPIVASNADDSFLAQLHDDEEEEMKILAGRRSSTSSSSSSSASSKECASSAQVFAIALSNRSLLDRASSMQFKSSSSCDTNTDVTEEEWM